MAVDNHVADKVDGSINIIGAAGHTDDGGVAGRAARGQGEGGNRGHGRAVVVVVAIGGHIDYLCSTVGVGAT